MTIFKRKDPVVSLVDRVSALGFPRHYVEAQIPSWWDAKAGTSPTAIMQLELTVARRLGLDVQSLLEGKVTLAKRLSGKLKRAQRYTKEDLALSTGVCGALAEAVAARIEVPYEGVPEPRQIRDFLVKQGAKRLSLSAVVMYCWHIGIPVIHASKLPDGIPKMDGIVIYAAERPVIILAKRSRFQAWLLFILAHELGHLASGHIKSGELLVDSEFEGIPFNLDIDDREEREANHFALELLNGTSEPVYNLDMQAPTVSLARAALHLGESIGVDPGHILLLEARRTGAWKEANAALGEYQDREDDARRRINKAFVDELKRDSRVGHSSVVNDEFAEFVQIVTGESFVV